MKPFEDPEWQAWRFASSLLMPETSFRVLTERNWTKKQIGRAFEVNRAFVNERIRQLKIGKLLRNG